jgi:hypothetical protein
MYNNSYVNGVSLKRCATADDLELEVDFTLFPRQIHIKYASHGLTQLWPTLRYIEYSRVML